MAQQPESGRNASGIARAGKRNFVIGDVQEVCAQLGGNAYCTVGVRTREAGEALLRNLGVPV